MLKLVWQVLSLAVAVGMIGVPSPSHAQETSPPPVLVDWTAPASQARLVRSAHKVDFFLLSNHFIGQDNKIFCGPTSVAIVLNALRPRHPDAPLTTHSLTPEDRAWMRAGSNPFLRKYTPHNVLTAQTKTRLEVLGKPVVINGKRQRDYGLQLRQLAQVFRAHDLTVTTRVVDAEADAARITRELAHNLATPHNFRGGQLLAPRARPARRWAHLPARRIRRPTRTRSSSWMSTPPGPRGSGSVPPTWSPPCGPSTRSRTGVICWCRKTSATAISVPRPSSSFRRRRPTPLLQSGHLFLQKPHLLLQEIHGIL